MTTDSIEIFESYIRSLNEAKNKTPISRADYTTFVKQHRQETTPSVGADAPDAHGATIGRNTALTLGQSDRIRDRNFEFYKEKDIKKGHYLQLTGEGSRVPRQSQKALMQLMREYSSNKYYQNKIDGNLIVPYWNVPDCIEYFTMNAKSEKDPTIRQAFIDSLIVMYELLSDKQKYTQVYENSKPVLRIKTQGGEREAEDLKDTYEEFLPKIQGRIKTLKLNPNAALQLKPFLFHNHTKPRQQVKFGSNELQDAIHSSGEEHTIFGQGENEPRHPFSGTDPTYGVSSAENITEPELRKIHIQDREQARSTPSPARSLGAPKAKRVRKKPIGESVFIKDIPF